MHQFAWKYAFVEIYLKIRILLQKNMLKIYILKDLSVLPS